MSDSVVTTPVTPTLPEPNLNLAPVEVENASATEAELNAKIDEELGLPSQPKGGSDGTENSGQGESDTTSADTENASGNGESGEDSEADTDKSESTSKEDTQETQPVVPATPSDEDLFIEVEDAEGVTHKISTIEDLPEDFEPKNNRQIMEIIKATDNLDAQRTERQQQAVKAEEEAFVEQTKQDQFKSWDVEIGELAKTGRVDAKNPERLNDVFGYMNEINNARREAGNPNLISSFEDALDKFEAKEAKDKVEADKKNGNATAKLKSGVIGRSSAASTGDRYVYRAGSARSIDDIPV